MLTACSTIVDVANLAYEGVEQKLIDATKCYRQAVAQQVDAERRYLLWKEVQVLEEDMRQVGCKYDQAVRHNRVLSRR